MSRDMNRREESLSQASTAPFRLWFLHYECFDSLNLRNFLTPSTQIKHDISFNDTHSSSRRCFFTYKRVSLLPLNIILTVRANPKK
ncbi:unnamed protein product, partial [Brassica oleracea var. botrytis]